MPDATPPAATLLVFGDLGRSPRMLHHALALAENGWRVALVGYPETAVDPAISGDPGIRILPVRTFRRCPEGAPRPVFLLWTLVRLAWAQVQALWLLVAATPRPAVVLVQNPPTVPTLFVGRLASRLRRARLIVDWHNFGYTMLALRMGGAGAVVRLFRRYEASAGRRADGHLCVSRAMADKLRSELGVANAHVLYDRPVRLEAPLEPEERRAIVRELFPDAANDTLVLHCPTSWTDDEDVGMLFEAVRLFETQSPARLFVVITGRGPHREEFEARLVETKLANCAIRTAFLSPEDYRRLLRAADCGVSLHRSSSGVDLPMKLVDFFGAGMPALALDYGACLAEQVQDGREALLFRDAAELAQRLFEITAPSTLDRLRRNVRSSWNENWPEVWRREALLLFDPRR